MRSTPFNSRKFRNLFACACMAMLLTACSTFDDVFSGSGFDDTVLPGERISVAQVDQRLSVDPGAQATPVIVPTAISNFDWTQPGGVPSNAPQNLALSAKPQNAWRVDAGEGSSSSGRLTAPPIVVGGRIYVIDTVATVHAKNAQTGKSLWSRELTPEDEEEDEGFGGGLASDGNRIFAATGFGNIAALDPANGKVLWNRKLDVPIRAAPTVDGGRLYITTVNNEVFALSNFDGEVVWKFSGIAESAGVMVNTSPAVSEGVVVVPYTSGDLIAFGTSDGRPIWNDNLTRTGRLSSLESISNIGGRPVIHRGAVFAIAHGGRMAALDIRSGQRLWTQDISGVQTPWAAGDFLFVVGEDNVIVALSANDGKVRWIRKLPDSEWSGPVLAGGQLLVVGSNGTILTLSPENGDQISLRQLGAKFYIPPVIANGTMYLYTDEAELIAMR